MASIRIQVLHCQDRYMRDDIDHDDFGHGIWIHLTCAWVFCKLLASYFPFILIPSVVWLRQSKKSFEQIENSSCKNGQTRNWTISMVMHGDYAWFWTRWRSQFQANFVFDIIYIDIFDTCICIYIYILMTPENLLMIFMTSHDRWFSIERIDDSHLSKEQHNFGWIVLCLEAQKKKSNYCSSNCLFNVLFFVHRKITINCFTIFFFHSCSHMFRYVSVSFHFSSKDGLQLKVLGRGHAAAAAEVQSQRLLPPEKQSGETWRKWRKENCCAVQSESMRSWRSSSHLLSSAYFGL